MRFYYSIFLTMALAMLISATSLLSGCGQKGPLYLPSTQDKTEPAPDKDKTDKKTTQNKSN